MASAILWWPSILVSKPIVGLSFGINSRYCTVSDMMLPMQFLFGLGNPGEKYQFSRHNVGFFVLEEVVRQHLARLGNSAGELPFRHQSKLFANIIKHEDLIFSEPQTYMN